MNREILFRAQRADTKEWVEGYIARVHRRNEKGEIESYFFNALDELGWSYECVVSAKTVCQYTGLNDSTKWEELSEGEKEKFLSERNHKEDRLSTKEDWNGREIFEGDIVKTSQYGIDDGSSHNYTGFDTFSVEFSDGGFCLKNKWRRFNLRPQRDFEVIGNIFDTPELLNQ